MNAYILKTCPHCGGEAKERTFEKPFLNGWIGCPECHCFINWIKGGKPLAITKWNNRVKNEIQVKSEWRPVKGSVLPDEGEHVLLTVDDMNFVTEGMQVCEAWIKKGIWQTATKEGVRRIIYPLAWMPKPLKYEEIEEK